MNNNLETISNSNTEKKDHNKLNYDLIKKFEINNIENISPNDFFLKFKRLYIKSDNSIVSSNIKEIKKILEKQDFFDPFLFFIKYQSINLGEGEIQIFSKELFERSNNLKELIDNISEIIYNNIYPFLEKKHKSGFKYLTFTTQNILISPMTPGVKNRENGLFGLDKENGKKLLYGSIKNLIITRGINFPRIKETDRYKGLLFSEFNIIENDIFSKMMGESDEKIKIDTLNFPNAKDFIIYCLKNFSGIIKNESTGEFIISNHLGGYIGNNINSFSFNDFKEILIESVDIRNSFFHYMLSTESDIIGELIRGTNHLNKEEIKQIDINSIKRIYVENYVLKQFEWGREFYIDTKENEFFIGINKKAEELEDIAIKEAYKIDSAKEQIKTFLGSDKNLLTQMDLMIKENSKSINSVIKKDIICINKKTNKEDFEKLINIMTNIYLSHNKNNLQLYKADNKNIIDPKLLENIINQYKKLAQNLIEKGSHKYDSLLYGYDKHFLPIGGKIHFKDSLAKDKIKKLKDFDLFSSTPFKLIHANESMLLPPCESPFQLIEVLNKLNELGIINDGDLELQLSIAGRLPNELSAILGSSMIFLKNYQISYPKEAFCTGGWDELTKSCIVCYDDGVLDTTGFSNIGERKGRTDILGVRKIEEIIIFSIVSNLISQEFFGGIHKKVGKAFIKEYKKLLEKHNISNILEGKWVHNPNDENKHSDFNEYSKHSELVNICTNILNEGILNFNKNGDNNSIIFELRDLIGKIIKVNNLLPNNNGKKEEIESN